MSSKQDVKVMLKEAGILFVITVLSGLILGFAYELTKEPRQLQQEKMVQEACAAVFSGELYEGKNIAFEEYPYTAGAETAQKLAELEVTIGTVYRAVAADGTQEGYVVEATSGNGYGGDIVLYAGIRTDGTVNGVSILEMNETAGLGQEAPNVLTPQFAGKNVESFVYTKTGAKPDSNEVDAITSATMTTRAVTDAVNGALCAAREMLGGGVGNE